MYIEGSRVKNEESPILLVLKALLKSSEIYKTHKSWLTAKEQQLWSSHPNSMQL